MRGAANRTWRDFMGVIALIAQMWWLLSFVNDLCKHFCKSGDDPISAVQARGVNPLPVNTNCKCLSHMFLSFCYRALICGLKSGFGCFCAIYFVWPGASEQASFTVVIHLWNIPRLCVFCTATLPHELWHLNWKHVKVKQIRLKLWTGSFLFP